MAQLYIFPRHSGVPDRNDRAALRRQALKVAEEAGELLAAIEDGEPDWRVLEESHDVRHAAETLQRAFKATEVADSAAAVTLKNAERGYYGGDAL